MNLKKKLKAFFTFKRRRDGGFTLVELIVVIAILAILAGVGSVGYAGYIKNANKNSDKVLVGNIMRAIETGTNSTMFVNDDSFKMGEIAYPVGIVTLGTNGTSVVTSQTEVYPATEGNCEWETVENVCTVSEKSEYVCLQHMSESKTICSTPTTYTYCKTHSKAEPQTESLTGTYKSGWNHTGGAAECAGAFGFGGCKSWEVLYTNYPSGAVKILNESSLYVPHENNTNLCQAAYANQYATFKGESKIETAAVGDPIYDSLTAAFGDLSALKLSYDGWTADEGLGYASFYTGATELMGELKDMAGTLAIFSGNATTANKLGLSQTYADTDEILTGVSGNLITIYGSQENMLAAWNNDAAMTWGSYGFNVTGRENYSALRAAYNNAFASYMDVNGFSAYSEAIRGYAKPVVGEFEAITLPALVCTEAFTNAESGLKDQLGCTDEEFTSIADLYKKYIESGACNENGKLVFDVFTTVDSTSDVAYANREVGGTSVYDYYGSYVKEISAMYERAQTEAAGGIVIVVVVEDGKLNFQISPSVANPRLDD